MFQCHNCNASESYQTRISETFLIDGKLVLVENIPATICKRCEEATFSRETTEKIRHLVQGETKPIKSVQVDVFAYA